MKSRRSSTEAARAWWRALTAVAVTVMMATALTGCNTSGCADNQNSLPLAGFFSYETGAQISVDSVEIGGIGAPGDSLLYHAGQSLSEVYLPFRSTQGSTSFYIRYVATGGRPVTTYPADTLTFHYSSMPYFAGEECGAMFRYKINRLEHTSHVIDSVAIKDSLITNVAMRQIEIFYPTSQAEEGLGR